MKIWLIYEGENFIAYADNKDILTKFISSRKNKHYNVLKTKYHKLPDIIRNSESFYKRQLTYFIGYNTNMKIPLIQFELEQLEFSIMEMHIMTSRAVKNALVSIKYIKDIDDDVEKMLKGVLNLVEEDFECEAIYDEVIDIDKYIEHFIDN